MTGRTTQLGRQLRKLRHLASGPDAGDSRTTLRRATKLACDLACEVTEIADAQAAFHELTERGMLEPAHAERLAAWSASHDASGDRAMQIGRDLDRLLRSLELGAPAPELPFDAIIPRADITNPTSAAAVVISGRVVQLEERDGRAVISVDEWPIPMTLGSDERVTSFALAAAPPTRAEVHREPTGVTRVVWMPANIAIELAPDFASVRIVSVA